MLAVALVVARLVLEEGTTAPVVEDDAILLVQRHGVTIGGCPTDAGPSLDAAGSTTDAPGGDPPDGGVPDAPPACETIEGDAVSMVVRPRFSVGPVGARFALLFVTPSRPIVEVAPDPFAELAALTAPFEDVHVTEVPTPALGERCTYGGGGCGFESNSDYPTFDPPGIGDGGLGDGAVVVETVGPYEIVRVQPPDAAALAGILDGLGYLHQQADLDAIAPYLARGYTVVAVRVAVEPKPQRDGMASAIAPLQLTWAGTELRLPVGLGTGSTDGLVVYVAGDGRFDFADAAVTYARHTFSGATRFVTRNVLPPTAPTSPDEDPVALHVPGDPEHQEVVVIEKIRQVPVENCAGDLGCGCGDCSAGSPRSDLGVLAFAVAFVLRPRRRRRRR
jgi:hypothetical protein